MRSSVVIGIILVIAACGEDVPEQRGGQVGQGGSGGAEGPDPEAHRACREKRWLMKRTDDGYECVKRAGLDEDLCRERGGETVYMGGYYWGCIEETIDGGTPCENTRDCDGYCKAPDGAEPGDEVVGSCSSSTPEVCILRVNRGVVQAPACT